MTKKEKEIFDLKLHEKLYIKNMLVIRVSGGWIYTWPASYSPAVFVPYSNELR